MTLIIGFKCKDGVALVSDTKIMDLDSGESFYESKILNPIVQAPFMVGAAGYTHLFREFNRKFPERVNESINRVRIANVAELIKTGLSRNDSIKYLQNVESRASQSQQQDIQDTTQKEEPPKLNIADIPLPNIYSAEKLMDDCKLLVKEISTNFELESDPIEVLIGLRRMEFDQPELHFINAKGNEVEIDEYDAIGSGSPYLKTYFDRVYSFDKSIYELITDAYRTITFAEIVAKENTVGCSQDKPPEAVVILNDGRFGRMYFKNEKEVIQKIKDEMRTYEIELKNHSIPTLEWDMEHS